MADSVIEVHRGPAIDGRTAPGDGLVDALRADGVETVVLAGADTHGILRGKHLPLAALPAALERGIALCEAIWALPVDEHEPVARPAGHRGYFPGDGYPDVLVVPDPATARIVPWRERTALVLCDFAHRDGAPVQVSPRGVLRRVLERARALGFEPVVGVELEFYVLRETGASVAEKRPSQLEAVERRLSAYGVAAAARHEPLMRLLRTNLGALGLPVAACHPEAGPGQFEINLGHAPALTAADHGVLLKSAVKELTAGRGLLATFMAKPRSDWPGSSCHLHLSLRAGGRDAFHDPDGEHGMSAAMRGFVAGLLAGMAETSALMAPTSNSYRRFAAHSWAATTATWSIDNRSAGLRVVCEGDGATRIEHRRPGGDANPYLAIAAALAGGLDGIERGLEPPEPVHGDVYALGPDAPAPLPSRLEEAVALLDASRLARDWLGSDFVDHFVAMRRAESAAQAAAVTDWETARYLEVL